MRLQIIASIVALFLFSTYASATGYSYGHSGYSKSSYNYQKHKNHSTVGPRGPRGYRGKRGKTGPAGPKGMTGPAGPQGMTGPAGPKGMTGPAGPQGIPGTPGLNGQDGAPGLDGQDGAPGLDGQDGAPGLDGQDGADADISGCSVHTSNQVVTAAQCPVGTTETSRNCIFNGAAVNPTSIELFDVLLQGGNQAGTPTYDGSTPSRLLGGITLTMRPAADQCELSVRLSGTSDINDPFLNDTSNAEIQDLRLMGQVERMCITSTIVCQ